MQTDMHVRRLFNRSVSWTGYELGKVPDHPGRDYLEDIRKLVGIPGVLFDVGANEGQSVTEFMRAFPQTQMHSFEPFPEAFISLEKTAAPFPGVRVNRMAMGAKQGEADLYFNTNSVTNSLLPTARESASFWDQGQVMQTQGRVSVPVTTLDDYCKEQRISRIDLLKIDTQGFDLRVLQGGQAMLAARQIRSILLELNLVPFYEGQSRPGETLDFLTDLGYRLVGFYHAHYQNNRFIKWCDGLFIAE